jgi:hypothetical protein
MSRTAKLSLLLGLSAIVLALMSVTLWPGAFAF